MNGPATFLHLSRAAVALCVLCAGACRPILEDQAPSEAAWSAPRHRPSDLPAPGGLRQDIGADLTPGGRLGELPDGREAGAEPSAAIEVRPPPTPVTLRPGERLSLFDGETLGGWTVTEKDDFSLHGEVRVEDGAVLLGEGAPYTGIGWAQGFPAEDYEIALEARRVSGYDIFCGLTAPVGDSHVTLVLGGWGDCVVGLSNVDHFNASENETTRMMSFTTGRWYGVRLRVSAAKIEAWIDGEQVVELARPGRVFTIYDQLEPQRPLGLFSWQTRAAIRGIEMRRLGPP